MVIATIKTYNFALSKSKGVAVYQTNFKPIVVRFVSLYETMDDKFDKIFNYKEYEKHVTCVGIKSTVIKNKGVLNTVNDLIDAYHVCYMPSKRNKINLIVAPVLFPFTKLTEVSINKNDDKKPRTRVTITLRCQIYPGLKIKTINF